MNRWRGDPTPDPWIGASCPGADSLLVCQSPRTARPTRSVKGGPRDLRSRKARPEPYHVRWSDDLCAEQRGCPRPRQGAWTPDLD